MLEIKLKDHKYNNVILCKQFINDYKKLKIKKEVGITIKSKETRVTK